MKCPRCRRSSKPRVLALDSSHWPDQMPAPSLILRIDRRGGCNVHPKLWTSLAGYIMLYPIHPKLRSYYWIGLDILVSWLVIPQSSYGRKGKCPVPLMNISKMDRTAFVQMFICFLLMIVGYGMIWTCMNHNYPYKVWTISIIPQFCAFPPGNHQSKLEYHGFTPWDPHVLPMAALGAPCNTTDPRMIHAKMILTWHERLAWMIG